MDHFPQLCHFTGWQVYPGQQHGGLNRRFWSIPNFGRLGQLPVVTPSLVTEHNCTQVWQKSDSPKNRSQFWATASTPCIAPHTSWETILAPTASSTDRCDEGSQSHHGFQYKNALMSLMTWMIWGTPILGTPPYRNRMDQLFASQSAKKTGMTWIIFRPQITTRNSMGFPPRSGCSQAARKPHFLHGLILRSSVHWLPKISLVEIHRPSIANIRYPLVNVHATMENHY